MKLRKTTFILLMIISWIVILPQAQATVEHYYINPEGGTKYHVDQYCKSTHPKYLPLQEVELTENILNKYAPCNVCMTPSTEPAEEPEELPGVYYTEDELNSMKEKWESTYGDERLWDYRVHADYVAEYGTEAYMPSVFNEDVLSQYPDEDAIPADEIEKLAITLVLSYGSDLEEKQLSELKTVVSAYKKPTPSYDFSFYSTSGTWIVEFWDTTHMQEIACIYIDAHTGIPCYLNLAQEGVAYIGEPGVEPESSNG